MSTFTPTRSIGPLQLVLSATILATVAQIGASHSSVSAPLHPVAAPAPGMCWYSTDPSRTQGFWDYCPQ